MLFNHTPFYFTELITNVLFLGPVPRTQQPSELIKTPRWGWRTVSLLKIASIIYFCREFGNFPELWGASNQTVEIGHILNLTRCLRSRMAWHIAQCTYARKYTWYGTCMWRKVEENNPITSQIWPPHTLWTNPSAFLDEDSVSQTRTLSNFSKFFRD
jgi:hypothetical protein